MEAKFDDFGVDSVSRKLTYPVGHRRFARNLNQRQKRKFGPKWSFAIASVDNRAETRRNYGLAFAKDSIEAVQKVLRKYLPQAREDRSLSIRELINFLESWKERVHATPYILI